MRAAASIGDLVRAVSELHADADTAAAIARLLGMAPAPAPVASGPAAVAPPAPSAPAVSGHGTAPQVTTQPSAAARGVEPISNDRPARATEVTEFPAQSSVHRSPRDIPLLETLLPPPAAPALDDETTLFVQRWQRGVLTALVSVLTPTGGLDLARIVDQIARRSAVQQLPRRSVYTTRMGLQLLVDGGPGMWPFSADVAQLEKLLQLTIAQEAVTVQRFDRSPRDGVGRGPRRTWGDYAPPPPGTPVLVVSDFGLAGSGADLPSATAEWEPVADAAAAARCPMLALTPFPESRWPSWLTSMFAVLSWDRPTTAALAKRAAERASRKYQ